MATLNLRQEKFAREYLIDFNGTQAAIRAGYSKNSAKEIAARLLTKDNVLGLVQKLNSKSAAKLDITHERIIEELARIGFSDIGQFVEYGPDGVKIKPSRDIDTRCLSEVSERVGKDGTGEVKFKLHDKINALTQLAERLFGRAKSLDPPAPSLQININIQDPRSVSHSEEKIIEAERIPEQEPVKVAFRIAGKNGNGNGKH